MMHVAIISMVASPNNVMMLNRGIYHWVFSKIKMKEIDILNLTKLVKQMGTQKKYFCYKQCNNHGTCSQHAL
jgi:hypothetical protein